MIRKPVRTPDSCIVLWYWCGNTAYCGRGLVMMVQRYAARQRMAPSSMTVARSDRSTLCLAGRELAV